SLREAMSIPKCSRLNKATLARDRPPWSFADHPGRRATRAGWHISVVLLARFRLALVFSRVSTFPTPGRVAEEVGMPLALRWKDFRPEQALEHECANLDRR